MSNLIIDTHAHYDDSRYNEDREALLLSMKEKNIDLIIEASASMDGCRETLNLIDKYDFIYGMLGVHPDEVLDLSEQDINFIKDNLNNKKIIAVGEIGLDYYGEDSVPKNIQEKWFRTFLNLAREYSLPVNIHSRDAAEDTYKIMSEENASEIGGIVHCFSYSKEMADKFIDMGFYIGIGGVVTFKNGKKLKEVVSHIPLDRIVLETDCPYLAPDPHRGERNDSSLIKFVANTVAALKGVSTDELLKITNENARNVYKIVN